MKRFEHVQLAGLSDVGKKRKNNEDAMGAFPSAGVFCVADGMGGGDDGEIASAAVVRAVEEVAKKCVPPDEGGYAAADVADCVEKALNKASAWIIDRSAEKNLTGCGSTFVGVVLDATRPDSALAVHAGDSRLYHLRGRTIKQITRDHSAAEMIGAKDEKKLNPMFRSMVMNAVGVRKRVDAERTPFKIEAGDRILICSDGLSRMVPDKKIASISSENANIDDAVRALIGAALDAGGVDNVTVVLLEIGALPPPAKGIPIPSGDPTLVDEEGDARQTAKSEADTADDDPQTLQTMQAASTLVTLQTVVPDTNSGMMGMGGLNGRRSAATVSSKASRLATTVFIEQQQTAVAPTRSSRRWIAIGGTAAALIAAAAVAFAALRKSESEQPAPQKGEPPTHRQSVATAAPDLNVQSQQQAPKPENPPAPTNAVNAPAGDMLPPNAGLANGGDAIGCRSNGLETVEKKGESAPVEPAGEPHPDSAAAISWSDVCSPERRDGFVNRMRLNFYNGNLPKRLSKEAQDFKERANDCAVDPKGVTAKMVERVVMEFKEMLKEAEEMKAKLSADIKNPSVRDFLEDWDKVLTGDVNDPAVQKAAVRMIKDESGALKR